MDILSIVKITIMGHFLLFCLNPWGPLYHGFYIIYDNYRLKNSIVDLQEKIYLIDQTSKAFHEGRSDTMEELSLKNGMLPNSNTKIVFLE